MDKRYRLIKDLPDLQAGTIFTRNDEGIWTAKILGGHPNGQTREYTFCEAYMFNKHSWFEPLIEPLPTEETEMEHQHNWQYLPKVDYHGLTTLHQYVFICSCGQINLVNSLNKKLSSLPLQVEEKV